jgi:hypothetical protein
MATLRLALRSRAAAVLLPFAAALASCDNPAGSDGPGAPARVDVVSGDLQTATVAAQLPQPLVVRVVDAGGEPVPGQTVSFRVLAGGGTVLGGSAVTDARGEARERWTLGTVAADSQRVEARVVDPATGQPRAAAVFRAVARADVPAAITPVGPAARMGTGGFPLADSLAVRVLDRFGNGVAGATVFWGVRTGGGSISPGTMTADAGGVARALWTLGTLLDSTQVAEAAAAVGVTTSFVASAGAPAGTLLIARGGNGQGGHPGTVLPQPVKVGLVLPDGRPVIGAVIAWSVGATGGSVTPATSVTDALGEATAQWTLPAMAGPATLTAMTPGAQPVTFVAQAIPGPVAALEKVSGDGQTAATAGFALPEPLVVRVVDPYGNGVPGTTVMWATDNGTLYTNSMVTDAQGLSRVRWVPNAAVPSTATATVAGLPPVTFTTQSQTTITIGFYKPTDAAQIHDQLEIDLEVRSTYSVTGVTAAVGTRTVTLQRAHNSTTRWMGQISLAGLPAGQHTLTVTATDASGATQSVDRPFTLDRRPTVEFRLPAVNGTVYPVGPVRIVAVCRDDAPTGCASMRVEIRGGTVLASGKDSVDVTYSGGTSGDTISLTAYGVDTRGTQWTESTFYVVESGPRLAKVAALGGQVVDFDGARALYQAPDGLRIRAIASGAEDAFPTPGGTLGTDNRKLTPRGALFVQGPLFPDGARVFERRDGGTLELGPIYAVEQNRAIVVSTLQVEGAWAAWNRGDGLVLRDLNAGTSTVLATRFGDLAANGDVVYARRLTDASPVEIMRYRGGTLSQLASGATGSGARTDGVDVVAALDGALVRITPAGIDTVTLGTANLADWDVVDGWTAFVRRASSGATQVWLASPAGAQTNVSALFDSAVLRTLGPGGQVVFQASGRLWLYTPGGTAVDIASDSGRPVWRNGELYILLANSVFRVLR